MNIRIGLFGLLLLGAGCSHHRGLFTVGGDAGHDFDNPPPLVVTDAGTEPDYTGCTYHDYDEQNANGTHEFGYYVCPDGGAAGSDEPQAGAGGPTAGSDAPQAGSGEPQAGSGVPQAGAGGSPVAGSGVPQAGAGGSDAGVPSGGTGAPQAGAGGASDDGGSAGTGAPQAGTGEPSDGGVAGGPSAGAGGAAGGDVPGAGTGGSGGAGGSDAGCLCPETPPTCTVLKSYPVCVHTQRGSFVQWYGCYEAAAYHCRHTASGDTLGTCDK
ncbi:MAG: hypothetical protein RLZZ324_240 [Candidatus Parcubacteria bacterium]|jgi:hypothetical protein